MACSGLLQLACEVIATASQNNPACQEAFLPSLPRLLAVVDDSALPDVARVKGLYAVSCECIMLFTVRVVKIGWKYTSIYSDDCYCTWIFVPLASIMNCHRDNSWLTYACKSSKMEAEYERVKKL